MIKLIGLRRIITLVVLAGINLLVVSSYFFGLDPLMQETRRELAIIDGQIAQLSKKIVDIKTEMAYLKENMPKYQALREKGLFQDQDRFKIGRLLEEMRNKAGLTSFSFVIDDLKDISNPDAAGVGYRLVDSRINIRITAAPLDNNIYAFLQNLKDSFSGHTYIKSFDIKRIDEVKEQSLNDISERKPVGYVSANIAFDWMTIVQKEGDPAATGPAGASPPAGFRGR